MKKGDAAGVSPTGSSFEHNENGGESGDSELSTLIPIGNLTVRDQGGASAPSPGSEPRKRANTFDESTASSQQIDHGFEPLERAHTFDERKLKTMADFHGTMPLCKGGFSSVSLTTHTQTSKRCVLKVLDRPSPSSLRRETWCLENLKHPNIVRPGAVVLGEPIRSSFVSFEHVNVLVFEHADGGDLFDYIEQFVVLEADLARKLFKQLLNALEYLHDEAGCCHLDIKTENILLYAPTSTTAAHCSSSPPGQLQLKLADFGHSCVEALGDDLSAATILSGTERSMAPEIHTNEYFNGKHADLWSAGVVFFNMLTGYPPFTIATLLDKSYKHIFNDDHGAFWRRFQKAADVANEAADLVNQLLQRDPAKRTSAHEAAKHPFFRVKVAVLKALEASKFSSVPRERGPLSLSLQPRKQLMKTSNPMWMCMHHGSSAAQTDMWNTHCSWASSDPMWMCLNHGSSCGSAEDTMWNTHCSWSEEYKNDQSVASLPVVKSVFVTV
jgi:serine/threonine protein kinase